MSGGGREGREWWRRALVNIASVPVLPLVKWICAEMQKKGRDGDGRESECHHCGPRRRASKRGGRRTKEGCEGPRGG